MKKTQVEINRRQKFLRKKNNNLWTKKYEKSRQGFLMRLYRNMYSRVTGIQKEKYHLYKNKTLLDKNSFYKWANSSTDFKMLFYDWENSGYKRKLTPSVNRINPQKGYELLNMEWVTHSENSRLGGLKLRNKK